MGIQEVATWYQKKIGTYDKQQWEKTIEQRVLHGLTHVRMKTAKPKTEFIDLDLIRGSSFPKAKPKHGLCVVTRLAIQRFLFFPLYTRWWIRQTSTNVFKLLFILYSLQFFSVFLYLWNWNETSTKQVANSSAASPESEIMIPILMMLILSIIHSLIVSTNTSPEKRTPQARSRRPKMRRRAYSSASARNNAPELKRTPSDSSIISVEQLDGITLSNKIKSRSFSRRMKIQSMNQTGIRVVKKTIDEGFESLNGNGSSENGEDTQDINTQINTLKNKEIKCSPESTESDLNVQINSIKEPVCVFKCSSDEQESDTESEPEMTVRKRSVTCKPSVVKEETDTDSDTQATFKSVASLPSRRGSSVQKCDESSCFESDGNEEEQKVIQASPLLIEAAASASECFGVTTNSEECSYSSESINSDSQNEMNNNDQMKWDNDFGPAIILSPSCAPSDLVSCTIWEDNDMKKADLSVLDISSAIIARVETMKDAMDYFYFGILFSAMLSILPILIRICEYAENIVQGEEQLSVVDMSYLIVGKLSSSVIALINIALGPTIWQRTVMVIALIERCTLACLFFFQLAVAERTFKQRFLFAKLFSHLTSSRKARMSDLPHFRLNKVRNIKTWLSVRAYLKKRGPQRSVDVIVSAAFIITLLLLSFVSIELVKNSAELHSQYSAEALVWGLFLGVYLLRFMTLGTKINSKYRNLSVLITEQINLYLQIEQKPHKKDELMVANSVLKLATDLLKELESPFKISGLSANPYLYTITKLVILSALSGMFSEMLGFKLKLHKLNLK